MRKWRGGKFNSPIGPLQIYLETVLLRVAGGDPIHTQVGLELGWNPSMEGGGWVVEVARPWGARSLVAVETAKRLSNQSLPKYNPFVCYSSGRRATE